MEYAPPPANVPGLPERLVAPHAAHSTDDSSSATLPGQQQIAARLAAHAAAAPQLAQFLARFGTLLRPLDGSGPSKEVLATASDVAAGVLRAKAAAATAAAAAQAAESARESAERTREFAGLAQEHAETAARELLSIKRAELQAVALLSGPKNADPAAAEVVKAQAAAKCAEQLKVRGVLMSLRSTTQRCREVVFWGSKIMWCIGLNVFGTLAPHPFKC